MSWLFEQTAPAAVTHEALFDLMQHAPYEVISLEFRAHEPVPAYGATGELKGDSADLEDREVLERSRTVIAMLDAAREEARAEMRVSLEQAMFEKEAAQQARVERMAVEFRRDRQKFFAAAEREVVHLALAIARRVLVREVEHDAMHLASAVRAALLKVQDDVDTVLRVPHEEADAWRRLLETKGGAQVQVVGSERLSEGECVLETAVGRIELGVAVQMAEIERGFAQVQPRDGL